MALFYGIICNAQTSTQNSGGSAIICCVCAIQHSDEKPFIDEVDSADLIVLAKVISVDRETNLMSIEIQKTFKGDASITKLNIEGKTKEHPCSPSLSSFNEGESWILGIEVEKLFTNLGQLYGCQNLTLPMQGPVIEGCITKLQLGEKKEYMTVEQFAKLF